MKTTLFPARQFPFLCMLMLPCIAPAITTTAPYFGDTVPGQWATDRYTPNSFALTTAFGRDNVLAIGIDAAQDLQNRLGAYQIMFYNTQGEGFAESVSPVLSMEASLYVPGSWQDGVANGWVRTDMWGETADSTGTVGVGYPIIGFANTGTANSGRFRVWQDSSGTWHDLGATVNYGAWNDLQMIFDGVSYQYFVNGTLAFTDSNIGTSATFDRVIMQAYNFGPSSNGNADSSGFSWTSNANLNYTANWWNAPEPGTTAMLGAGLAALLAAAARRRRIARQR